MSIENIAQIDTLLQAWLSLYSKPAAVEAQIYIYGKWISLSVCWLLMHLLMH